ncbi:MAG: decaprenyl-phosphate phosphoribosyltransferase [Candidatus Auribacterota bacterium]|jgi:4-hydroxybenzoate polyprenyltransferase|nr:decaprenyl-phosphate phosphoribosyltransferase [Candidatus Auribacterota bacterium]
MSSVRNLFFLLRPKQWTKNLFLFAALFFSKNAFCPYLTIRYFAGFILFCFISSSHYIINDIIDRERDKLHPRKKMRPIASGAVSVRSALVLSGLLALISFAGSYMISPKFFMVGMVYYIMNFFYSIKLKGVVIVDILCIAIGFVLRVIAGSYIGDIYVSNWLLICTLMLSLFLGFTKRRHELVLLEQNANPHRPILGEYSTLFLDQMISVVTTSTVVFYILYTVALETIQKFKTDNLIYTTIFVLYGIFRYLYIVYKKESGGDPTEALLTDIPLMINIFLWIIMAGIIVYR